MFFGKLNFEYSGQHLVHQISPFNTGENNLFTTLNL